MYLVKTLANANHVYTMTLCKHKSHTERQGRVSQRAVPTIPFSLSDEQTISPKSTSCEQTFVTSPAQHLVVNVVLRKLVVSGCCPTITYSTYYVAVTLL